MSSSADWYLYLLRCVDGSLYTGISTDVARRVREHGALENSGGKRGAKSLRGKRPLQLVFSVAIGDRSAAQKLEYRVKRLSHAAKEDLVREPQLFVQLMKQDSR